jgi:hypothetical protein
MPLLSNELARRENGRLELRTTPMRLRWNLDELVTADGHRLHCTFTASISAINDPAEWRMLEEVFITSSHHRTYGVTGDAVVAHFMPGLRAAASKIAGDYKADHWVKGDAAARQALIDALREAGKAIAFSAGVEFLPPFAADFESATYQAQQVEQMQRTLAERRVAGQVEHFERASKLLKQFKELREAAPDLSASDILKQVSPADQGLMLQTLLMAAGKAHSTSCLWAVAGTALVKIDGRATPASLELTPLPDDLGPLRSVQPARVDGQNVLLVGARSGVVIYDPEHRSSRRYADRSIDSQLGFSSAVVWNNQVWACHGDAGVVAWNLGEADAPMQVIRPVELRGAENPPPVPTAPSPQQTYVSAGGIVASMSVRTAGIRNLSVLDEDRIVFSVGRQLTTIDKSGIRFQVPMESDAEVLRIIPQPQAKRVAVVQDDGTIGVRDLASLEPIARQRRTGRLTAAAPLPWLGEQRLLLATHEGPIHCVGLDDELVTQYMSSHRGLRAVCASADLIAAVSSDRQRVVLWNSWDGKTPMAELSIASATRHRVGDIEFA